MIVVTLPSNEKRTLHNGITSLHNALLSLYRSVFLVNVKVSCFFAVDLMKPGTTVIIRNSKIDMFKGSMRLAVDKWGRVEVTEPAKFEVKEDNNLSLVEYELVNVEV